MKRNKTRNWLATAALLPLLAGSVSIGCDDDENTGTDAAAGRGGSGGTGGGTGGTGGGTGGTGGTGGGGVDAGDMAPTGDVPAGCAAQDAGRGGRDRRHPPGAVPSTSSRRRST
jgi:hypothetical protein